MANDSFKDIEKLEAELWEAADNLRANSKLNPRDYFMPVLGVIFLRHAANRFDAASRQIEADQASGKVPKRKIVAADYVSRRALWLPEEARYDRIMHKVSLGGGDPASLVVQAMEAIENDFEPLKGVLPRDYGIFESKVLEDLLRTFNSEQIKRATGDVFGRIYEYFLAKFSIQKAHDNGEYFTPSSIVQTIVNVIEPDHGIVFDPACGSGGMFVQSSHFIEAEGLDTAKRVVFYGHEKDRTTTRLAIMNLAVHGLEGRIAGETITYYSDPHTLGGKCDFVMANPPFNVDLVDAERVKSDPRLPFGLPGVNKQKRVSNGNYLWISYFWSYLSAKGRAGFDRSARAPVAKVPADRDSTSCGGGGAGSNGAECSGRRSCGGASGCARTGRPRGYGEGQDSARQAGATSRFVFSCRRGPSDPAAMKISRIEDPGCGLRHRARAVHYSDHLPAALSVNRLHVLRRPTGSHPSD